MPPPQPVHALSTFEMVHISIQKAEALHTVQVGFQDLLGSHPCPRWKTNTRIWVLCATLSSASVCVCAGDVEWWWVEGRVNTENRESMKTSFVTTFPQPVNPIVLNKEETAP